MTPRACGLFHWWHRRQRRADVRRLVDSLLTSRRHLDRRLAAMLATAQPAGPVWTAAELQQADVLIVRWLCAQVEPALRDTVRQFFQHPPGRHWHCACARADGIPTIRQQLMASGATESGRS